MNDTVLMGIALALALAGGLYLIRDWIDAIPARVRAVVMRERERDERKALDALQEATARRVGAVTKSLRNYEEQIAATFRVQMASAEERARTADLRASAAEREAKEAVSLLSTARELVAELRVLRDAASPAASAPTIHGDEQDGDDANAETKVIASPGPLRVPVRRPPPVPRTPPPAHEEAEPATVAKETAS